MWSPLAGALLLTLGAWTDENPFNGHAGPITENPVDLAAELSVTALAEETTGGWVGVDVAVADELGPAERPNAATGVP